MMRMTAEATLPPSDAVVVRHGTDRNAADTSSSRQQLWGLFDGRTFGGCKKGAVVVPEHWADNCITPHPKWRGISC